MTPAEQVANELAVCGDEGVVRTTPAEVLATLTGQAPAQSAPARLAEALRDWGNGRSGMVAAGAVIDAARALLVDHERLLAHRAEAIDALTAERDRLHEDVGDLHESLNSALERATYAKSLQAERDRLAAQVRQFDALRLAVGALRKMADAGGVVYAEEIARALDGGEAVDGRVAPADQVQAVRDLATEWILTGEVAAVAFGRAVIAKLDGHDEPAATPGLSLIGRDRVLLDKLAKILHQEVRRHHDYTPPWETPRGSRFEALLADGRVARITVELDRMDGGEPL